MYCIQQARVQKRVFWVSRGPDDIHKTTLTKIIQGRGKVFYVGGAVGGGGGG